MFPINLFLLFSEHTSDRYLLYIIAFLQRVKHFATYMKGSGMKIRHPCLWCLYSRVKDYNSSDNPTNKYLRMYHCGCWEGEWARSCWFFFFSWFIRTSLRLEMGQGSCFTGSWTLKNKTPVKSSTKLWTDMEETKCVYCVKGAMLLKLHTAWFPPTFW